MDIGSDRIVGTRGVTSRKLDIPQVHFTKLCVMNNVGHKTWNCVVNLQEVIQR